MKLYVKASTDKAKIKCIDVYLRFGYSCYVFDNGVEILLDEDRLYIKSIGADDYLVWPATGSDKKHYLIYFKVGNTEIIDNPDDVTVSELDMLTYFGKDDFPDFVECSDGSIFYEHE